MVVARLSLSLILDKSSYEDGAFIKYKYLNAYHTMKSFDRSIDLNEETNTTGKKNLVNQ